MKSGKQQAELFSASRYRDMSILDLHRELGKIRKRVYAMQMAYEASESKKKGESVITAKDEREKAE